MSLVKVVREPPTTALLIPIDTRSTAPHDRFVLLTHDGPCWVLFDSEGQEIHRTGPVWCPAAPESHMLRSVSPSWRLDPPSVEVIGLDKDGAVHATGFRFEGRSLDLIASRSARSEQPYLAATRSGPGPETVVAVSATKIDWLSVRAGRFRTAFSLSVSHPFPAVACFPSNTPEGIVVVFSDGYVVCLGRRSGSFERGANRLLTPAFTARQRLD